MTGKLRLFKTEVNNFMKKSVKLAAKQGTKRTALEK
jgi:hypothetical protein